MESQGLLQLQNGAGLIAQPIDTELEGQIVVADESTCDVPKSMTDSSPVVEIEGSSFTFKHSSQSSVNRHPSDSNFVISDNSVRARLRRALNTHRFQVAVVSFVIIDCMIVIAELLMDLRLLSMEESNPSVGNEQGKILSNAITRKPPIESQYLIPDVLHSINIAILCLFLLESVVKIVAFGLAFLRLGWEIFDTVVVSVTFVLDVLMQHSHSSTNGLGLLIILRLWRVARILNGMVRSVKLQADRHMECEKRRRQNLEEELVKCQEMCEKQRKLIHELEIILQSHDISLPFSSIHG